MEEFVSKVVLEIASLLRRVSKFKPLNYRGNNLTTEPPPHIGELLKKKRESLGKTQAQLADDATVTSDTISNLELGKRTPRPSTIGKIARALGIEGEEYSALLAQATGQDVRLETGTFPFLARARRRMAVLTMATVSVVAFLAIYNLFSGGEENVQLDLQAKGDLLDFLISNDGPNTIRLVQIDLDIPNPHPDTLGSQPEMSYVYTEGRGEIISLETKNDRDILRILTRQTISNTPPSNETRFGVRLESDDHAHAAVSDYDLTLHMIDGEKIRFTKRKQ